MTDMLVGLLPLHGRNPTLRVRDLKMDHPFNHPASNSLFKNISKIFKKKSIFQKKDRHIIFVCGGPVRLHSRSLRNKFIKYQKKYLKEFRIFIAEVAAEDISIDDVPEFYNIADFESFFANFADCVLIFPESAGSISEISYFSKDKEIARNILIANDITKQYDSFINLGPIDKIDKISIFKPHILIDSNSPNFDTINERLKLRLPRIKSKRFRFRIFSNLNPKEKLYVIFQIIYIFKVMTIDGIFCCISEIFKGNVDRSGIKKILSFLVALKYIKRVKQDSAYFTPNRNIEPFLEFRNYDVSDLQVMAIAYFRKYHEESYDLLKEIT